MRCTLVELLNYSIVGPCGLLFDVPCYARAVSRCLLASKKYQNFNFKRKVNTINPKAIVKMSWCLSSNTQSCQGTTLTTLHGVGVCFLAGANAYHNNFLYALFTLCIFLQYLSTHPAKHNRFWWYFMLSILPRKSCKLNILGKWSATFLLHFSHEL